MKKIGTILLLSILLFSSCVKEEPDYGGNAPEGKPALVSLKIDMAAMGSAAKTRAMTPEQEQKIENLRVLIFNSEGHIVTNKKYTGNPGTSLDIETMSGKNCKIYIVANTVQAQDDRLATVGSLSALQAAMTTPEELGFGVGGTKSLTMTGKLEGVNIQPGTGNTLASPIQLHFFSAKLTLIVRDATGPDEKVTLLGWDIVDVPQKIHIFPNAADHPLDVNNNDDWLSTSASYPFEAGDDDKTGKIELYLPENRRGGRVNRALPDNSADRYPGMAFGDKKDKGKKWYAPKRAMHIVIYAMHKTADGTRQVTAYIYLGGNNHSDYNLERGNHYTFTVTVTGLNNIRVDTNVDYVVGDFRIDHGTNLNMDAHPDYRPMRIHATAGKVTMEVLDAGGRGHDEVGYAPPTWVKISPLNLMYHQVKQSAPNDYWQQQAGEPGSFVRAKYIPHRSYRKANQTISNTTWWTEAINRSDGGKGQFNDDVMKFADATYRMCYAITDIGFADEGNVTTKTLCVYADEFLSEGGSREVKIRFRFYKEEGNPAAPEERIFTLTQQGYLALFDERNPNAGLQRLNEDGTPSGGTKKQFVFESVEEVTLSMNPGIDPSVQMTMTMQWGLNSALLYNNADKNRNGYFLTANAVYKDVTRRDNEPVGFGKTNASYRPMYGNGKTGGNGVIPDYTGTTVGPYYQPKATDHIYHPIYKSSAARYCHEKNRDLNGDGIIDASETKWYLPSQQELQMAWIAGLQESFSAFHFWSATESNATSCWGVGFGSGSTYYYHYKNSGNRVRCVREL